MQTTVKPMEIIVFTKIISSYFRKNDRQMSQAQYFLLFWPRIIRLYQGIKFGS